MAFSFERYKMSTITDAFQKISNGSGNKPKHMSG